MHTKTKGLKLYIATALLVLGSSAGIGMSAHAASACPEHYAGGQPPQILNPKMEQGFVELCAAHGTFATGYSKLVRSPLYSAERITRAHMIERAGRGRVNSFRPDDRLKPSERAELEDYKRSGYDRGHLVPDADSWNDETEGDTYVLSNMIPQVPENNRGIHADIEKQVRVFAKQVGEVYVITGPIFDGAQLKYLNNRVAIPTRIFKLLYVPSRNEAAAYLEQNDKSVDYRKITLDELNKLVGMNMLPGVKSPGVLDLPRPMSKR